LLIGFTLWLVTGYFKGWFGDLAMAFLDAIVSLPVLLFILPIVTFMGRNWLFISLVTIPFLSALVAKAFKQKYAASPFNQKWRESNKENQYISLTKTMFASFFLIMASVILLFFTVDFLGFGDPSLPTWGREYAIIQEIGGVYVPGQGFLWWWFVPPGLFTALLILGFMLLGSSLDEEHSKVANSLNN
jgi:peptide/nickel transport system permease protein